MEEGDAIFGCVTEESVDLVGIVVPDGDAKGAEAILGIVIVRVEDGLEFASTDITSSASGRRCGGGVGFELGEFADNVDPEVASGVVVADGGGEGVDFAEGQIERSRRVGGLYEAFGGDGFLQLELHAGGPVQTGEGDECAGFDAALWSEGILQALDGVVPERTAGGRSLEVEQRERDGAEWHGTSVDVDDAERDGDVRVRFGGERFGERRDGTSGRRCIVVDSDSGVGGRVRSGGGGGGAAGLGCVSGGGFSTRASSSGGLLDLQTAENII